MTYYQDMIQEEEAEAENGTFCFITYEEGEIHFYSKRYHTEQAAFSWYYHPNKGKWLREEFEHELYFVQLYLPL